MRRLLGIATVVITVAVFAPSVLAITPAQTRLSAARLRVCQLHETVIKTRLSHLGQLASSMEDKFASISGRVQTYYTNKVLPSGKTVANYDTLVTDISTKKAAVDSALTKAKTDVAGFDCTVANPKGQLTSYRLDMQAVKQALKDYRTAIKDLIVAVRSIAT